MATQSLIGDGMSSLIWYFSVLLCGDLGLSLFVTYTEMLLIVSFLFIQWIYHIPNDNSPVEVLHGGTRLHGTAAKSCKVGIFIPTYVSTVSYCLCTINFDAWCPFFERDVLFGLVHGFL